MSKVIAASGNQVVAEAFRQAEPDVLAAYPITPQTIIVEDYAKFVADGLVHTEFVAVESEHSAMSATIGAASAGGRACTATASQGLALMWEELHIAAGMRLPIVMANANRALSAPINIHGDHSDVMGARDTGWILLFAENAQEAYDNTVISFKIAEHEDVMLPVMTTLDGFITSHALERVVVEDDELVKDFVGEYNPKNPLLDTDNPTSHGMFASLGNLYMENKFAERVAIDGALPIIKEIGKAWAEKVGREFELVHTYGVEDAERIIVVLGSSAGNARHVARLLRDKGEKVGVVNIRCYRPFPAEDIVEALKGAKAIAVMDRADSFGAQGAPVALEVRNALYEDGINIPTRSYVYGLGGADVTEEMIEQIYTDLADLQGGATGHANVTYIGNR